MNSLYILLGLSVIGNLVLLYFLNKYKLLIKKLLENLHLYEMKSRLNFEEDMKFINFIMAQELINHFEFILQPLVQKSPPKTLINDDYANEEIPKIVNAIINQISKDHMQILTKLYFNGQQELINWIVTQVKTNFCRQVNTINRTQLNSRKLNELNKQEAPKETAEKPKP